MYYITSLLSFHYSLLIYFSIKTPALSDKPYKFPPRAKPAPPVFELTGAIGQHSPISSPFVMSPHPLQNRVPRGERASVALCCEPVSAAASVGAGRSPLGSSTRGGRRDKSFCPCQKTGENTGFSPVLFFHVLHGNGVHSGSDAGVSLR